MTLRAGYSRSLGPFLPHSTPVRLGKKEGLELHRLEGPPVNGRGGRGKKQAVPIRKRKTPSRPPGLGITHVRPRQARLTDDKTEAQRGRIFIRRSRPALWHAQRNLKKQQHHHCHYCCSNTGHLPSRFLLDGCADLHNGPARQQCWDSGFHFSRRGDSGAARGKGRVILSPSHVARDSVLLGLLFIWTCNKQQRRQWEPTPVLLPGKSHGRRSLVGCSPWGR